MVTLALQTTEPDILILDADFPDVDMFAIVRQALETRPGLAVLLVSSDPSRERMRQAMLTGAEDYLVRPLQTDAVRQSILRGNIDAAIIMPRAGTRNTKWRITK